MSRSGGGQVVQVGDCPVMVVSDGDYPVDLSVILDLEPAEAARLAGVPASGRTSFPVNVFLIALGDGFALVDSGAGPLAGPAMGHAPRRLRELGVAPDDIRHVLLTHLHPDHAGGLVDGDGDSVYPRAEILLHEREAMFWLDGPIEEALPDRVRRTMAAARRAMAPYRTRTRRIKHGDGVTGERVGVGAVELPGHTPGHTGWMVKSGGDRLLLWGDIVHFDAVQTAHPEASLVFDIDRDRAKATRRAIFDRVVREGLPIGGAHLPSPGFGRLVREDERHRFEPMAPACGERTSDAAADS
ncbi:MBL fold metallo-hydrolase [Azospirillum doebereinerae]